ncbi:MAG TPA: F0F1 ATP synthase subunit B [Candidatus Rifleibacterium sp.]|nr:F0F1 ATP synthase subunit B [Candidatus Rifleibacterium sp.]HPT45997.1 F0F1 ATP synthase subunit B [Candidatus Rifleibacterium sp.]
MIKAVFRRMEAAELFLLLFMLLSVSVLYAAESGVSPVAEHLQTHEQSQQLPPGATLAPGIAGGEVTTAPGPAQHGEDHGPGLFDFNVTILISQTINFFVMLFLLKRFLFVPISKIIEERRTNLNRIKDQAQAEQYKAIEYKQQYEKHLENLEAELYQRRQQAILDTEGKVAEIIQDARKRAETIIEHGEMELFMERQSAWARIREEVVQLTLKAAEKVVEESLDDNIHRRLIESTIEKLSNDLPDYKSE